jgi:hypothetical protein
MDNTRKYQEYENVIYKYHAQLFAYNYHKNDKEKHYK